MYQEINVCVSIYNSTHKYRQFPKLKRYIDKYTYTWKYLCLRKYYDFKCIWRQKENRNTPLRLRESHTYKENNESHYYSMRSILGLKPFRIRSRRGALKYNIAINLHLHVGGVIRQCLFLISVTVLCRNRHYILLEWAWIELLFPESLPHVHSQRYNVHGFPVYFDPRLQLLFIEKKLCIQMLWSCLWTARICYQIKRRNIKNLNKIPTCVILTKHPVYFDRYEIFILSRCIYGTGS